LSLSSFAIAMAKSPTLPKMAPSSADGARRTTSRAIGASST
jgi:hypothetical protein